MCVEVGRVRVDEARDRLQTKTKHYNMIFSSLIYINTIKLSFRIKKGFCASSVRKTALRLYKKSQLHIPISRVWIQIKEGDMNNKYIYKEMKTTNNRQLEKWFVLFIWDSKQKSAIIDNNLFW